MFIDDLYVYSPILTYSLFHQELGSTKIIQNLEMPYIYTW
jgi:hypothetical protein